MKIESMRTRSYRSFKVDDADLPAEVRERLSAIQRRVGTARETGYFNGFAPAHCQTIRHGFARRMECLSGDRSGCRRRLDSRPRRYDPRRRRAENVGPCVGDFPVGAVDGDPLPSTAAP